MMRPTATKEADDKEADDGEADDGEADDESDVPADVIGADHTYGEAFIDAEVNFFDLNNLYRFSVLLLFADY